MAEKGFTALGTSWKETCEVKARRDVTVLL